jgi:hypothetical protein
LHDGDQRPVPRPQSDVPVALADPTRAEEETVATQAKGPLVARDRSLRCTPTIRDEENRPIAERDSVHADDCALEVE